MECRVEQYRVQILNLLPKFLETDGEHVDFDELNRLWSSLEKNRNSDDSLALIDIPFFTEWLTQAVAKWSSSQRKPQDVICAFVLNLTSLAAKNEIEFYMLTNNNLIVDVVNVLDARNIEASACVKLAYIKLLSSFLEHQSGIEFMIANNFWEDAFGFAINSTNLVVIRDSRLFLSKVLDQVINYDEGFCKCVINKITSPVAEDAHRARAITASADVLVPQELVSERLRRTVELLGEVLEYFLKKVFVARRDIRVLIMVWSDFQIKQNISALTAATKNKCLVFELDRILLILDFLELYIRVISGNITLNDVDASLSKILKVFEMRIPESTEFYGDVLKYCKFSHLYWKLINDNIPMHLTNNAEDYIAFPDRMIVLQLIPIGAAARRYFCNGLKHPFPDDEIRYSFVKKVLTILGSRCMKIFSSLKYSLWRVNNLFEISTQSLIYILRHRQYLDRKRAAIVVQMLIYCLKDALGSIQENPEKLDYFLNAGAPIELYLDVLTLFIEEFKISWSDCVETIDVLDISFEFLKFTRWPSVLVIKALKLLNISLKYHMSPNLALLIDRTSDSATGILGELLDYKLQDCCWKTRCASLQTVTTLCNVSVDMLNEMGNRVEQYRVQILNLLQKFLEPQCEIEDFDDELNQLSSYLKQNTDSALIDIPFFTGWLIEAVTKWSSTQTKPDDVICAFVLDLASLVARNELEFCILNNNNLIVDVVTILQAGDLEAPTLIKLSYIKLLSSFLEHQSGSEWMIANILWEDAFWFALSCTNLVVIRDSRLFLSKFLDKIINQNEGFCKYVISKIISPLAENVYRAKAITAASDVLIPRNLLSERLRRTVELLGEVLEYFLKNVFVARRDFRILQLFCADFELKQNIATLIAATKNKYLLFELDRILLIIEFLELYFRVISGNITVNALDSSLDKMLTVFQMRIFSESVEDAIKYCKFGGLYWKLVNECIPVHLTNNAEKYVSFPDVIIILQLFPVGATSHKYFALTVKHMISDEVRWAFITKLITTLGPQYVELVQFWKRYLYRINNLFETSAQSLVYALKYRKYFDKKRATILVQILIYTFKDIIRTIKEDPDKLDYFLKMNAPIGLYFDVLSLFIEEFKISWSDCVETIDVLDISFEFLKFTRWPPMLVIKALKLLNISLKYRMSPNLALLIDRTSDSATGILGDLLDYKLQDCCWEIRRAALETVATLCTISIPKFPSLQKVLMDSDLPGLVVKMAIGDGESFVRATAIKCLQEMIQVEEIWNNSLKSQDLSGKMRQILINETEGIVRVEAATFMCISYENNQFPEETLERVYETMIHSSTTDLHWEVKVRALNFWDKVINNHLQHQGMIDGSFPSVTFSKEHRKIVTLTDAEIKKRLLKVLGQLSSIGCLGVLISAIRDDCDMEVSKTAVKITQKLVELLKKYNIHGDCSVPTSPQPTENGMSSSASISSGVSGDDCMSSPVTPANSDLNEEIINQIVNSRDVNLLQNVYTPSDYGSVLNYDLQVRTIVSPNEFLLFTQQDLNVIINEKKNWLNGIEDLGSLLDDMLKSYDDDVNSMDCY